MEVAELYATLDAKIGALERNAAQADAILAGIRRGMQSTEDKSRALEAAFGRVKIPATAAAETKAALDAMERSLSPVTRKAIEASDALKDVKTSSTSTTETVAELGLISRALEKARDKAIELKLALREDKTSGIGRGGGGSDGGGLLSSIGAAFPGGARATGVGFGVAVGAGALAAAPLIPSVGVIAAIPALVAPAAAALGVLALGFSGLSKAIGGNKAAYEALAPAQKAFVNQIRELEPILDNMKQVVGQNLFGPMASALKQVTGNAAAMGQLGGILKETAQAIGEMAGSWIKFLGSTGFLKQFNQVTADSLSMWKQFSGALQDVVKGLLNMAQSFSPLAHYLTDITQRAAQWFEQWSKSSQAVSANQAIINSLQLVGKTAEALIAIIKGLVEALAPIGNQLLRFLLPQLQAFGEWLQRNAKTIDSVLKPALEGIEAAFKGVVAFIKPFGPTIEETFKVASEATKGFGMEIDWVGNHMHWLANVVNWSTKGIASGVSWMASEVAGSIGGIKTVIQDVVNGLIWLVDHIPIPTFKSIGILGHDIPIPTGVKFLNVGGISLGSGSSGPTGTQGPTGPLGPVTSGGAPPGVQGPITSAPSTGPPNPGAAPVALGSPLSAPPPFTSTSTSSGASAAKKAARAAAQARAHPYVNPFAGKSIGRIDQGVDYGGSGPIRAIGDGVVRESTGSSGWPGGGFVSITLSSGPRVGWTYYVAEGIRPSVSARQRVSKGQVIGEQTGGIEAGWVSSPTQGNPNIDNALTSQLGQNAVQTGVSSDPGYTPGGVGFPQGQDFNAFINSIGTTGAGGLSSGRGAGKKAAPAPPSLDWILPPTMQAAIRSAQVAVTRAATVATKSPTAANIEKEIQAEQAYQRELEKTLAFLDKEKQTGDRLVLLKGEEQKIAQAIKTTEGQITKEQEAQAKAALYQKDVGLLQRVGIITPANAGIASIQRNYDEILKAVRAGHLKISNEIQNQLAAINQILQQKLIDPRVKSAVATALDNIKSVITQKLADIKSLMGNLQSGILSAFDAINSQTPASKQLQVMQHQDTMRQLNQQMADAKTALSQAGITAPGDNTMTDAQIQAQIDAAKDPNVKAAWQQYYDAQRALEEQNLSDQDAAQQRETKDKKNELEKQLAAEQERYDRGKESLGTYLKNVKRIMTQNGITPQALQNATDWQTAFSLFGTTIGGLTNMLSSKSPITKSLDTLSAAIANWIKAIQSMGVRVPTTPGPSGGMPHADSGGLYQAVPGGLYRIAEAGHPEAVIPLDPAKRNRALTLMNHVAGIVGFASGGLPVPPGAKGSATDTPANRAAAAATHDWGTDNIIGSYVNDALLGRYGRKIQVDAMQRAKIVDGINLPRLQSIDAMGPAIRDISRVMTTIQKTYPDITFEAGGPTQNDAYRELARLMSVLPIEAILGSPNRTRISHLTDGAVHYGSNPNSTGYLGKADLFTGQPSYADGGIINLASGAYISRRPGGVLARIGEGAHDEVVIPVNRQPVGHGGGGGDIHHHIYLDSNEIAHTITQRQLRNRRLGGVGFLTAAQNAT